MNLEYRPPTAEDLAFVAAHMRDEDVREVAETNGHSPLQSLILSVGASQRSFCGVIDGAPVCIFGFAYDPAQDIAGVWLLGTPDLLRHRKTFVAESRRVLSEWEETFGEMFNHVSVGARHTRRWLRSMGFTEEPAVPHGVLGAPFVKVVR